MKKCVAVIDIGTNSVLLTIAEKRGKDINAVLEEAVITRLGEGLGTSKRFSPAAVSRTLSVLKKYSELCAKNSVSKIYTVGTAAMRKAENSDEFIALAKKECGLDIEVISGEREAELSFKAAERDFGPDIVVLDIGGGSTEVICLPPIYSLSICPTPTLPLQRGGGVVTSLPLGCVTLHERFCKSDPIGERELRAMIEEIDSSLDPRFRGDDKLIQKSLHSPLCQRGVRGDFLNDGSKLVATAGTATTLAAMKLRLKEYNHSEVHGSILTKADVEKIIGELKSRTIEERKKLPGLEPKRADVILPGALILNAVMERLGLDKVTVSDRGIRWGIVYEKLHSV